MGGKGISQGVVKCRKWEEDKRGEEVKEVGEKGSKSGGVKCRNW